MEKNILIPSLFIGLLAFTSCKGTSENGTTAGTDTIQTKRPRLEAIHLTRTKFLKKVADYKNRSKEWKYLGDRPAIVDFYADWYGPCKMVAPILEELSKEYAGKIYIYKADVDKEPRLAKAFGIQSIPALWFIPMREEPQVSMGALSEEQLEGYIDGVLLKSQAIIRSHPANRY